MVIRKIKTKSTVLINACLFCHVFFIHLFRDQQGFFFSPRCFQLCSIHILLWSLFACFILEYFFYLPPTLYFSLFYNHVVDVSNGYLHAPCSRNSQAIKTPLLLCHGWISIYICMSACSPQYMLNTVA